MTADTAPQDGAVFDPDVDGPALEKLRLDLLKVGPASGITGPRAREVDQLLRRAVAFASRASENRRARLRRQKQGGLL